MEARIIIVLESLPRQAVGVSSIQNAEALASYGSLKINNQIKGSCQWPSLFTEVYRQVNTRPLLVPLRSFFVSI
jgi:hypothetical protein